MPGSKDGQEIWTAYAKGIKPIGGKRKSSKTPIPKAADKPERIQKLPNKTSASKAKEADAFHHSLDRNMERRLRQGGIEIDARLDLHGMRQEEAHEVLHDFITRQIKLSARCLLIITGKGRDGKGVLRANLTGWLAASAHSAHILALRPAAPKHGGGGAFYILLKKRRDSR